MYYLKDGGERYYDLDLMALLRHCIFDIGMGILVIILCLKNFLKLQNGENIVIRFEFFPSDKKGIFDCGIWKVAKGYHESIVYSKVKKIWFT